MEARFCTACGKALNPPGAAFCGSCGAAQAKGAVPQPPAATAAPPPSPAASGPPPTAPAYAPPPAPVYAPPPPASAPYPLAAPSLELLQGEVEIDRWGANSVVPGERMVAGKLIVTNQRVLFNPQTNVGGTISVLLSFIGRAAWKQRHTLVIDKTQILHVGVESGLLGPRLLVQLADGRRIEFDRGIARGVEPIIAAIQQR